MTALLGPSRKILASAIARVFVSDALEWQKLGCGVLSLVKDAIRKSYYFSFVNTTQGIELMCEEMYSEFTYERQRDLFVHFEGEKSVIGVSFFDLTETHLFCQILDEEISRKGQIRSEKQNNEPSLGFAESKNSQIYSRESAIVEGKKHNMLIKPPAYIPKSPQCNAKDGKFQKLKDKLKKRNDNSEMKKLISQPYQFRHAATGSDVITKVQKLGSNKTKKVTSKKDVDKISEAVVAYIWPQRDCSEYDEQNLKNLVKEKLQSDDKKEWNTFAKIALEPGVKRASRKGISETVSNAEDLGKKDNSQWKLDTDDEQSDSSMRQDIYATIRSAHSENAFPVLTERKSMVHIPSPPPTPKQRKNVTTCSTDSKKLTAQTSKKDNPLSNGNFEMFGNMRSYARDRLSKLELEEKIGSCDTESSFLTLMDQVNKLDDDMETLSTDEGEIDFRSWN